MLPILLASSFSITELIFITMHLPFSEYKSDFFPLFAFSPLPLIQSALDHTGQRLLALDKNCFYDYLIITICFLTACVGRGAMTFAHTTVKIQSQD